MNITRIMISFRPCVMHITNLNNSIYSLHKINNRTFSISSCFSFKHSLINNNNQLIRQLIYSTDIVDSAISKQRSVLSKHILIINGMNKNSNVYEKQCKLISTDKFMCNRVVNKQSLHFGTNQLFVNNNFTTRNYCSVRQMSSFYERTCDSLLKNYINIINTITESKPVEFVQNSLVDLHTYTGLPWWGTIVLGTILLRLTISLPMSILQQNILAKIANIQEEMIGITFNLKRKIKSDMFRNNWSQEEARRVFIRSVIKARKDLIVRDNCHPMKIVLLAYIYIPIMIISIFSLRNLCFMLPKIDLYAYENYLELTTGGFGWITNLTEVDSFFILPILTALTNLAYIQIVCMLKRDEFTRLEKYYNNFRRLISVLIIPLSPFIPSAVCLYWMTSASFSLGEKFLLISPKFRRLTRIPKTELELSHPYSFLYEKIKSKTNLGTLLMKKLK